MNDFSLIVELSHVLPQRHRVHDVYDLLYVNTLE